MAKKYFWLEYKDRPDEAVAIRDHNPVMAAKRFLKKYPAADDEVIVVYTEKGYDEQRSLREWTVEELQERLRKDDEYFRGRNKIGIGALLGMSKSGPREVKCPRCGSEQLSANKKGYGVGKGIGGGILAGPIGLLAGFFGSQKVMVTCLNCGKRWKAGRA